MQSGILPRGLYINKLQLVLCSFFLRPECVLSVSCVSHVFCLCVISLATVFLFLTFLKESPYSSLQWLYQFTFLPTVQEDSLFSTPSSAFIICRFFDDGHSDWCEVMPHRICISLLISAVEHLSSACWPSVCF